VFSPSREQVRDLFFDTWRKYRAGEPLAGIETLALEAILLHPEYHALLSDPARHREREYVDETNPFLHMSLHVALLEQLSIDQPPGISAIFRRLEMGKGERHAALHEALDCLAETVWRSQRDGLPPDAAAYLACLEGKARTD
jgi:hypothetical protein